MISIKHLKSGRRGAAGVAKYLEHSQAAEGAAGYYQGDQSAPSRWLGQGAAELGLQGPVARDDLINILEGRLPNGQDLAGRGNRAHDRRLGTDLTVSSPKSYSIVALTSGDERLLAAWDEAVEIAAGVIEREVISARRGHGGAESEHTGVMVAAAYRHEDTRTVDGRAAPDLHTHLVVANATRGQDGTWSARDLDFGEQARLLKIADFSAKAHLARRVQEMGYQIRRTEHGFEIDGVSREAIEQASPRKGQIDEALQERGTSREESTAAQRAAANIATRGGKSVLPRDEQRWAWRQDAREVWGVDIDAVCAQARAREAAGLALVQDLSTESVRSAARHLGERETVFPRDALRLEALRAGMGAVDLAAVDLSVHAQAAGLIHVGGNRYTTRTALHREQEILQRARAGRGQAQPLMSADQTRDYISRREQEQGYEYSAGQRQALALGLTSSDRIVGVVGAAGAGKTTSMKGIVEAAGAAGVEVIGIAPSSKARNELESAGAEVNRTVASFLIRDHERNDNRLVILDEAGMVSGRDMDLLLQKIEQEGGRLLLVGDPKQLRAVEAGAPFAQMLETGAIAHATIDEIQRQADPVLRAIAQSFARGDAAGATTAAMNYAITAPIDAQDPEKPTTAERREGIARAAAGAYLSLSVEERDRTLVLSGTNAVRQQANAMIRAGLQEQGRVSLDEVKIQALDKADLTRERATRSESYREGMVVRLEDGAGRERRTTDYTVSRVADERVVLQDRDGREKTWDPANEKAAGVYQSRDMSLAVGDQVIFRENHGRGDDRIVNGQTATITSIERGEDGRAMIAARLDDGRKIGLDPERSHTLDYGWCRTIHSSQGATVDRVIVAGEASRVATAEGAYVACSRERHALQIITDSPERLQKSWEQWAEKHHAIEAARETSTPDLSQLQQLRTEAAAELGREGDLARARERQAEISTPPVQQERGQAAELDL